MHAVMPMPIFLKMKKSVVKPIVTVPDRRGGLYRKLSVGDLITEFPNQYVCDSGGAILGQVKKVLPWKALLMPGKVYFLLPKSYRPPSSWSWKKERARHPELAQGPEELEEHSQTRVLIKLVSPKMSAAFVVDGPRITSVQSGESKEKTGVRLGQPNSTRSLSRKSNFAQWAPALETIKEPQLTRSTVICKNLHCRDNPAGFQIRTIEDR